MPLDANVEILPAADFSSQLEVKYVDRTAIIGVIGMGYVGLPLMLAAEVSGFRVVGFDVDPEKVEKVNAGQSYLKHIRSEQMIAAIGRGRLRATANFEDIGAVDAIIICVPTPLTQNREPDLTFVRNTT